MRAYYDTVSGAFWRTISDEDMGYSEDVIEATDWPSEDHVFNGTSWVIPTETFDIVVPKSISFAQLLIGLVTEGWITEQEGINWRDRVSLPSLITNYIATLPTNQQFAATTRALAPSEVNRDNALVLAIAVAAGKTTQDLDNFFITYSNV